MHQAWSDTQSRVHCTTCCTTGCQHMLDQTQAIISVPPPSSSHVCTGYCIAASPSSTLNRLPHAAPQVIRNQIMSLTLKIKGGLRLRCIPLDHMPLESVLPTSCAHMAAAAAAHQLAPAGSLQQHSSAFSRASSLSASLPFPALASAFAAGSGGLAQMDRAPSFAPPPPPGLGLGAHAAAPGNAPALPPLGWPHVRYSAAAAEPSGAVSEPHTPPATSSGTSGTASGTPAGAAGARAGASPTSPPAGVGGSPVGSTTTTPSLLARLASGSFLSSPRSPVVSSSNQVGCG
jgi:hypothetical protein